MAINYQKQLDETLMTLAAKGCRPRLLLHACCAPCASYVLEYLSAYFRITLFFYNPNIAPQSEYEKRLQELQRFCAQAPFAQDVDWLEAPYEPEKFDALAQGLEDAPEGGMRCTHCFRLRLTAAALAARQINADYFTTTLSISPHKNAPLLNQLGQEISQRLSVPYLCADFKKKDGYKRSIALSQTYALYRQDYCGCRFSRQQRLKTKQLSSASK